MYNYLFTEFLNFISKNNFLHKKFKILRLLEENSPINKTRIMSNLTGTPFHMNNINTDILDTCNLDTTAILPFIQIILEY